MSKTTKEMKKSLEMKELLTKKKKKVNLLVPQQNVKLDDNSRKKKDVVEGDAGSKQPKKAESSAADLAKESKMNPADWDQSKGDFYARWAAFIKALKNHYKGKKGRARKIFDWLKETYNKSAEGGGVSPDKVEEACTDKIDELGNEINKYETAINQLKKGEAVTDPDLKGKEMLILYEEKNDLEGQKKDIENIRNVTKVDNYKKGFKEGKKVKTKDVELKDVELKKDVELEDVELTKKTT